MSEFKSIEERIDNAVREKADQDLGRSIRGLYDFIRNDKQLSLLLYHPQREVYFSEETFDFLNTLDYFVEARERAIEDKIEEAINNVIENSLKNNDVLTDAVNDTPPLPAKTVGAMLNNDAQKMVGKLFLGIKSLGEEE